MRASDGNLYVVKFQNNPQGTSVLANEMLAAKLAKLLGLSVPATVVVELPSKLSESLYFETPRGRQPILPGRHLGSPFVIASLQGRSYDYLPRRQQYLIRNPDDLIGIQLFDLWTCNRDTRQVVYWKYSREKKYTASFIDNGHCFGGPNRKFGPMKQPDWMLTGAIDRRWLRWADRIATLPLARLQNTEFNQIPPEWVVNEGDLEVIYEELKARQEVISEGIKKIVSRPDDLKSTNNATLSNSVPTSTLSSLNRGATREFWSSDVCRTYAKKDSLPN